MITAQQCRAARAGLEWSRGNLAKAAGLAERTVNDFERGAREPHANNKAAIRAAFERKGVAFTNEGCVCFASDAEGDPAALDELSTRLPNSDPE